MNELASGGGDGNHVNNDARSDGLLASVPDIEVQGPNSFPLQRITSQLLDRQKISVIFRRMFFVFCFWIL
jgi:hypothetical protein